MILNSHKERTDRLSLLDVANEFTDRNSDRKRNFGIFKVSDHCLTTVLFLHRFVIFFIHR